MFATLKMLLPALVPSWRFFDVIPPSPRIEYRLLKAPEDRSTPWQEFRPRPQRISFLSMFRRMIWNPEWNETLFMMSCAERLIQDPTKHTEQEIFKRLWAHLGNTAGQDFEGARLQYRLLFLNKNGANIETHTMFTSPLNRYSAAGREL